jgi:DNA-binding IclR family transcriptional regulator
VTPVEPAVPRAQTRSLERGLRALEFVAIAGEAGVTDVANALQIPRASAHILLSTLARAGYVRQVKRRGSYRLDLQVVPLAQAALRRVPVRERAAPLLHQLAARTQLAAYLAVLFRGEAMTIDRILPVPRPEARTDLGQTNPAYASSMGKALLAHLPTDELELYLGSIVLEPRTERTITSVEDLRCDLALVRERGYALSEGEHLPNVRSVAAPVFSYEGEVVAAICAPHYTPLDQPPPDDLIRAIVETAKEISYALGYGAKMD